MFLTINGVMMSFFDCDLIDGADIFDTVTVTTRLATTWNKTVWICSVTLRSSEQWRMATTHLHWGPLHPRHTGKTVEDGETDRNGDKETANEGPQVALPCPHLLSHHLDGQQEGKKETFVQH